MIVSSAPETAIYKTCVATGICVRSLGAGCSTCRGRCSDPPLSHLRRGAARHVDPIVTDVKVSLSARGPKVFVPPAMTVSMARWSMVVLVLPDECSCFLSSWDRPHLVLPTLRAQERDEHALYAHLLRHDFRDLLGRPMKRMRDYFRRVGRAPRHFHCPFRGKQDATLFFLLRPVVAVLGAARRDPLPVRPVSGAR